MVRSVHDHNITCIILVMYDHFHGIKSLFLSYYMEHKSDLPTLPGLAGFSRDFAVSPGVPVMAVFLLRIAVSTPTLQQHFKGISFAHAQPLYFDSILSKSNSSFRFTSQVVQLNQPV